MTVMTTTMIVVKRWDDDVDYDDDDCGDQLIFPRGRRKQFHRSLAVDTVVSLAQVQDGVLERLGEAMRHEVEYFFAFAMQSIQLAIHRGQ